MPNQPVSIELLPTPDRCSAVVLFRSSEPIPMSTLIDSLEKFSKMLFDRFEQASAKKKLVLPPTGIIT